MFVRVMRAMHRSFARDPAEGQEFTGGELDRLGRIEQQRRPRRRDGPTILASTMRGVHRLRNQLIEQLCAQFSFRIPNLGASVAEEESRRINDGRVAIESEGERASNRS